MHMHDGKSLARRPAVRGARRGATMVIMAVMLSVLMMFAAFGVDFARMYTFSAQLKTLTDAASLAAAMELKNAGTEANAKSRATALKSGNRVEGANIATIADSNIVPGQWNYNTRVFTAGPWNTANAVRARAWYDANWTLARVFGVTSRKLRQESIAAIGSVSESTCLRPWAVPYSNLLQTLGRSPTDTSYRLTAADVATLANANVEIKFKISSDKVEGGAAVGGTIVPGNYYAVRYGPVEYADGSAGSPSSGAKPYGEAIADTGCTDTGSAGVGDWLEMENGNMKGPTNKALDDFCGALLVSTLTCNKPITVPIWNAVTGKKVKILYMGSFVLKGQNGSGEVVGYLTALNGSAVGAGFRPIPGPVAKAVIVE